MTIDGVHHDSHLQIHCAGLSSHLQIDRASLWPLHKEEEGLLEPACAAHISDKEPSFIAAVIKINTTHEAKKKQT
jgi:hypothetical protein